MSEVVSGVWADIAKRSTTRGELARKIVNISVYNRYLCYMKDKNLSPSKVAQEAFRGVLEALGVDTSTPHPLEEDVPLRAHTKKAVAE